MTDPRPESNADDLLRAIDASKSYVTPAVLTMVLYFVIYVPGLIANVTYLNEALRLRRRAGRSPSGIGCLWVMFVFGLLPLFFFVWLFVGMASCVMAANTHATERVLREREAARVETRATPSMTPRPTPTPTVARSATVPVATPVPAPAVDLPVGSVHQLTRSRVVATTSGRVTVPAGAWVRIDGVLPGGRPGAPLLTVEVRSQAGGVLAVGAMEIDGRP